MYEESNLNYLTKDKSLGERKKKTKKKSRIKVRHQSKLTKLPIRHSDLWGDFN